MRCPNRSHPKYNKEKFEKIANENNWTLLEIVPNPILVHFCNSQFVLQCNCCNYIRKINQISEFLNHLNCRYCTHGNIQKNEFKYQEEEFIKKYKNDVVNKYNKLKPIDYIQILDFELRDQYVKLQCNNCKKQTKCQNKPACISSIDHCRCFNDLTKNICPPVGNQRTNPIWFAAFVQENGYTLLDTKFGSLTDKYNFLCKSNHKMRVSGGKILTYIYDDRDGCIICNTKNPGSKIDLEKAINNENAKKLNLRFIDNYFTSLYDNHRWRCLCCNRILNRAYYNLYPCRFCFPTSEDKNEEILKKILVKEFSRLSIKPQFKIIGQIISNIKSQEKTYVDFRIFNTKHQILIEYNGAQHYQPVIFQSNKKDPNNIKLAEDKFIHQQTRDNFVREYCKNNNIKLFEIDGRFIKGEEKLQKYVDEHIKSYIIEFFK